MGPKVHHRVHKNPPIVHIMSQTNQVHILPLFLNTHFILTSHVSPGLPPGFFLSGFPIKTLYALLPHMWLIQRTIIFDI